MGVKKIARPINQAKNDFLKWLKDNKATDIEIFEGKKVPNEWNYYRTVTAFIGNDYYSVYFKMFLDEARIDYDDDENSYSNMTIEEFKQLID